MKGEKSIGRFPENLHNAFLIGYNKGSVILSRNLTAELYGSGLNHEIMARKKMANV